MRIRELIDFMGDLTIKTGYPVPVPDGFSYKWALKYNFNREGKVVLYTGALYQLIPYIESLSLYLMAMEKSDEGGYIALKFARSIPRDIINKLAQPDKKLISWSYNVLTSIANLLLKSKITFSYLYENDIYSGVLLYDMGDEEKFKIHINKVFKLLKQSNAEKIITVDPHTTYILKNVYPKYIDGFDLEVNSYLELIEINDESKLNKDPVVIHDSCIYARGLSLIDVPRKLLSKKGYEIKEPRRNKSITYCCGGPIEAIFPSLSKAIAKNRMEELSTVSNKVITMCPICYINLSKVSNNYNTEVHDISEML
ncbi:(Fe-S)-binding protein [Caldisphaera sp.]|uniref:(Fe-S)-binding protein n=1 Tax=Caldisphaera sp. TaxID=2060322 RepID=UPI0025BD7CF3|nr:(Fe-S)-binding protein [Caldisphaera sp.]